MYVHEIVAIRKGADKTRKIVELNAVERVQNNKEGTPSRYEGLEISNTIHLEGTQDDLEGAFGKGFEVGDQVRLDSLVFEMHETGD